MTMAHLWACDGKGTSLTLISWIPTVQRRGQEPLKTDSLMNLLKFLTLLRRSSNLRVSIVAVMVCPLSDSNRLGFRR